MEARHALALFACLLAAFPGLAAQAPESQGVDVLPHTSVEVVRLEVVVTEKRGRPRAGLRREDFAVFENGQPQPVVQFQAFARERWDASRPASGAQETDVDELEDLLPARYVVLVIDDVHMGFGSLTRVRKALARFIDEDLRPEDQVALVTTSGASALSQEFTADREALRYTLSRLSAQGRPAEWTGVPHITEHQAELIETGDPMALDAAVEEILQAGIMQDVGSAAEEARRKARSVYAEAVYNSRLTLEALERLCRGLSGLSGRKALLLVTEGFLTGLGAGSGSGFDMRRIADAATRAGVVVYTLDTGGLKTPLAPSASSPLRLGPTTVGTIEAIRWRSEHATRDAMHALAADTGGFLAENSNNLRSGLREILEDTEMYYVLAYEPTNTKRDGRFRRIEVRLPGLRGLRARTRAGYFAADDRRLDPTREAVEAAARRDEQRRAELRSALGSLAPLSAIPVRLSAAFVSVEPDVTRLVVSGSVDVAGLPFVRRNARRQAAVETTALVYDEAGGVAAALETERSTMDLSEADYEQLLRSGLPYEKTAVLAPGRYQVRLAAREDATGLLGSAWQWIDIPDLARGRLALSSLFLLKEGESQAAPASPDAAPVLRSAQALPRFSRDESLYVQLFAYNPARDAEGRTDLVVQAEVRSAGAMLGSGAPEPMAQVEPRGPVPHTSRIRLRRFEPGDYELRVTVTDRNASALATRAVAFSVR